jgi:hypothetical protein
MVTHDVTAMTLREVVRRTDTKDLSGISDALQDAGDTAGSTKLRKVIEEASVRKPDAFREAMDKSANNGRR